MTSGIRTTDLPTATSISTSDTVVANVGGITKKVEVSKVANAVDFLSLSDTPNSYSGYGGTLPNERAIVGINSGATALEFRYSTPQYVDIRDYGTVAGSGGDITAAVVAAMAACNNTGHNTVYIPMVGNGQYLLDGSALSWTNDPWIFLFDCDQITLTGQLKPPSGSTWRGLRTNTTNNHVSDVVRRPTITANSNFGGGVTGAAVFIDQKTNILFECLNVHAYPIAQGNGLYAWASDTMTFRDCVFSSAGAGNPCHIDSCFWWSFTRCSFFPNTSGVRKGLKLSTMTDHSLDCGLGWMYDVRFDTAGIEFIVVYSGGRGVDNIHMDKVAIESMVSGNSLFNFDSSGAVSTNHITGISADHITIADSLGTAYTFKNLGGATKGVRLSCLGADMEEGNLYDPTSVRIKGLVLEFSDDIGLAPHGAPIESVGSLYRGQYEWSSYFQNTLDSYSGKLRTAPIGVPWVIGTPLNVPQSGWTALGGATVTGGLIAPDGSLNATRVTGGTGARIYQTTSLTVATGDYLLAGIWLKGTNTSKCPADSGITLSVDSGSLNGTNTNNFSNMLQCDTINDMGWFWHSGLFKITAGADTTPTITWTVGSTDLRYAFPTLIHLPASSAYDEAWLANYAMSWRGGVNPAAQLGEVAYLSHQNVRCGPAVITTPTSVAGLPAASTLYTGARGLVTDATTNGFLSAVVGGSTYVVPVFCDGTTVWKIG